jgi:hypothetical protein
MTELRESEVGKTTNDRRSTAEKIFAGMAWENETTGYCLCPGHGKHTTSAGKRDCRVTLDNVPTVYCLHASCSEEIAAANKALRAGSLDCPSVELTPGQKKENAKKMAKDRAVEALKVRAGKLLPVILKQYVWPHDQIIKDSPVQIGEDDRLAMYHSFMGLFENEDVIWIGSVTDTGKPEHFTHFKTKAKWLDELVPVGPYTCPSCFVPDLFSRSKDTVSIRRYLVVESDTLKKDEVGAIFRWLDEAVELPLRVVVDTAGKSLHGWFEFPPPDILEELKIMLPAMGCDSKMFGSSQPCRLPGGMREGRIQRLIYLAKGGAQ